MLLAVRPIDLAIFGTMGALWLGGALFIVLVWRWVIRYERESQGPSIERDAVPPRREGASTSTASPRPQPGLPIDEGLASSSPS